MTVTQELIADLHKRCSDVSESGTAFFSQASHEVEGKVYRSSVREAFSEELLAQAESVRSEVRDLAACLVDAAQSSPLMGREDISDAVTAMKTALAALRLKDYQRWDTQVLSDEDTVLGVRQAGQTEQETDLSGARRCFVDAMLRLADIAALLVPGRPLTVVGEDHRFARMAIEEARKSESEDGRAHPLVGAVVVKDGRVLATAHRGEVAANHAEYIALEKKLDNISITGCTVYTTLEPCTTRKHPKIPCADRLIERKVDRVVIGMLDPNPNIRGRGMWKLQEANIAVEIFPHELTREIQELNRQFIRSCLNSDKAAVGHPKSDVEWRLTEEGRKRMAASLKPFAASGRLIDVVKYANDSLVAALAYELSVVLKDAGWKPTEYMRSSYEPLSGLLIEIDPRNPPTRAAADALLSALSAAGLGAAGPVLALPGDVGSTVPPGAGAAIRLTIGAISSP